MGFCQRINTVEGSYMCTHGKCMCDHLLACVSISLALISLCAQACVYLKSVSVKCPTTSLTCFHLSSKL